MTSINPTNPTANSTATFDEEFNTLNIGNGRNGTWDTNYWYNTTGDPNATDSLTSNGEQEWYIDGANSAQTQNGAIQPWTVNNGVLSIKASPTPSSIASDVKNYPYISGMLQTHGSFSQQYGLFEARMELPQGQGFWPAFWLMPENGAWPPELDVMENLGNDTSNYYTTVHSQTLTNWQSSAKVPVSNTTGYHTYAVDWEADYTTFYEDGQQVYKVATPSDMNSPMYMILNLAVGGGWPGNADSTTNFNHTMNVDWVKVYQNNDNLAAGLTPQGSAAYYGTGGGSTPPSGGGSNPGSGSGDGSGSGSGSGDNSGGSVHHPGGGSGSGSGSGSGGGASPGNGGGSVGYTDNHDYLGDGHSQVLLTNANNGDVFVGEAANGQLNYSQIGQVGAEWHVAGSADYLGQGHDQFLMQNANNGDLDLASVSNGQASYTQVGQLGSEWSLQGTGTYLGDGSHGFLIQNANNGDLDVGSIVNGQAQYANVAQLGAEWKVSGSGAFLGNGHDQFLMQNANNGDVDVGNVVNGQAQYTNVAQLGAEWKMQGAGDYLGDGKSQFLMENANNGDVVVGEVGSDGHATYTTVGQLGAEWKFVGTGDVLGQGHDQVVMENTTNGDVEAGAVVNGQLQYSHVSTLGSEWSFHM